MPADNNILSPDLSIPQLKSALQNLLADLDSNACWQAGLGLHLEQSTLLVEFAHPFFSDWFNRHKRDVFEARMRAAYGDIKIVYGKTARSDPSWSRIYGQKDSQNEHAQSSAATGKLSFADFLANDKNAIALAAAQNIVHADFVAKPDSSQRRILVICGPSGSGKTHLLNIIEATSAARSLRTVKNSANIFCQHSQAHAGMEIETFWRDCQLLLLDDLQEIAHHPGWQNLLVSYIDGASNGEWDSGSRSIKIKSCASCMVFAFCGFSSDVANLAPRLRSRLECGLIVELQLPDLDVRLRYLENANRERKFGLAREQLLFIARRTARISQIRGILRKIEIFATLHGNPPPLEDMARIIMTGAYEKPVEWHEILVRVARKQNLKVDDVLGQKRSPDLVLARQLAMYLCRIKLGLSYPEIGKLFGGRDHSTVMHAIKKVEGLLATDKDTHKLLTELEPGMGTSSRNSA